MKESMTKNDALIQCQQAYLTNLEIQMRQLATKLRSRPQGKFPTNTKNPKREREQ